MPRGAVLRLVIANVPGPTHAVLLRRGRTDRRLAPLLLHRLTMTAGPSTVVSSPLLTDAGRVWSARVVPTTLPLQTRLPNPCWRPLPKGSGSPGLPAIR